jgi:hypothetical protein
MGLAVPHLERLALCVGHRPARNGHGLASQGLRLFWTWKIRHGQPGRPAISREVRDLIRKMCRENPSWGAHHVFADSALTDIEAELEQSQTAVSNVAHISRESCPATGLHRLLHGVHHPLPVLYVFLVLAHDRLAFCTLI